MSYCSTSGQSAKLLMASVYKWCEDKMHFCWTYLYHGCKGCVVHCQRRVTPCGPCLSWTPRTCPWMAGALMWWEHALVLLEHWRQQGVWPLWGGHGVSAYHSEPTHPHLCVCLYQFGNVAVQLWPDGQIHGPQVLKATLHRHWFLLYGLCQWQPPKLHAVGPQMDLLQFLQLVPKWGLWWAQGRDHDHLEPQSWYQVWST